MEASRIFLFFVAVILCFNGSHLKPASEWKGVLESDKGHSQTSIGDAEIEEISKKEYDTVHGRILAVNEVHMRKRRAALGNATVTGNDTAAENSFQQIEGANRDQLTKFHQGDIDLEGDYELKEYIEHGGKSRNAIRGRKRLWTDRIIPYRIPPQMSHIASNVQQAINEFHRKTCVRFKPYNSIYHDNYIEFVNTGGCSSKVGKKYYETGRQLVSIAWGCNFVGTIIHEMMHALGFFHEQSRSDRDKYVKIYWENIRDGLSSQFDKYSWETIDDLGVSYDYQSIMHYDRKAFSRNGRPTIVAIGNENMDFKTPNFMLSTRDAVEINALYDCKTQRYGWSSWSGWTPCDKDCFRTRERFCYHSGNLKSCGGNVNSYGVEVQKDKCPTSICPAAVDGGWSRWSDWSDCSKTCNDGTKTRFRKCNNPEPAHNGKPCAAHEANDRTSCIMKRCTLDQDDVDFENFRLGMWTNSGSDSLNWQFNKGFTKTMDTGPSRDHTSGLGYYLYVESSETNAGQNAQLISPWQTSIAEGKCLKFYYTMSGETMGSLGIKIQLSDGRNWFIFYERGDQGIDWKKGTGNINVPLGLSYKLTIEAKIGKVGYSDIAIDDVYIDPGLCSCQDDFFTCQIWAAKGECSTNPTWMKENCKRSCKTCSTAAATLPPPTTKAPVSCEDTVKYKSSCPAWTNNGECTKNPGFMKVHCRKSCNNVPTCVDSNINCPAWAQKGECAKNPGWMNPNCKSSCCQCI